MPGWLQTSIVLSVGLTVLLNVVPRLFPGSTRRAAESVQRRVDQSASGVEPHGRAQVFFPWKWMIALSVAGTIALNLFI